MKRSLAEKLLPAVVRNEINRSIDPHLRLRADGNGVCSNETQKDRRELIHSFVAQLWHLGFKIKKVESLGPKHVKALMNFWAEEGRSPSVLHNRLSILRTLCGWLGKRHVALDLDDYLPKERTCRKVSTEKNLSWEANDVSVEGVIAVAKTVDERLAVMLALQHQFGLRTKESIEFRPFNALDDEGKNILVYVGTKGAKPRLIPIETEEQRATYEWARSVVAKGKVKRLRWPNLTEKQAQSHFYHMVARHLGLTKAQWGVTAHGLRHGYAQRKYFRATGGFKSPIENMSKPYIGDDVSQGPVQMPIPSSVLTHIKSKPVPPPGLTREMHERACMLVSRAMGHERVDVTASYYGTYGHALRTA